MVNGLRVYEIDSLSAEQVEQLTEILIAVVDQGASVGYLPPLDPNEAGDYWRGVCRPGNVLLIAENESGIVGTAQIELSQKLNGRHRAEINKVLVHPNAQRQGIGRRLMEGLDAIAKREGRTTLHRDTRDGDPSNSLYLRMGYVECGRIPSWAMSADGTLHTT